MDQNENNKLLTLNDITCYNTKIYITCGASKRFFPIGLQYIFFHTLVLDSKVVLLLDRF